MLPLLSGKLVSLSKRKSNQKTLACENSSVILFQQMLLAGEGSEPTVSILHGKKED